MLPAASWWVVGVSVSSNYAWPEDEQGFIPGQLPLLLGAAPPRRNLELDEPSRTQNTNTGVTNDIALHPTILWFKQKFQRIFADISVIVPPVGGSLHGDPATQLVEGGYPKYQL